MKFWQKAFLCTIVLFIISFDISVYLIIDKSYSVLIEQEMDTAINDHYLVKKSLYERLTSVSENYAEFNASNLAFLIQPYAEYYSKQQVYFDLYLRGELVYTSFMSSHDYNLDVDDGEIGYVLIEVDDTPYLLVESVLDTPVSDIKLTYIKNEQQIKDYYSQIINYCILVSVIVSFILAAVIIAMLLKLTSPLRKLNRAALEISAGNYNKRVETKSRDEVGELALSFNLMSTNIETHIEELSRLTEAKQQFIDNLAHEIRTPITAILGYGDILKNANISDDEKNMALNYIISQSNRIKNLSAKLIDLAYLDSSQVNLERVTLVDIFQSIQASVRKMCQEKNIELSQRIEIDYLYSDRDWLEMLLQNLVENAIRAVPINGNIIITATLENDNTTIFVADNGIGMEQAELSKISEPFYRVDKSRSRKYGGVGLGLSLCNRIAEVLNADLEFISEAGKGTTVKVKFTTV